jgi:hypothetical protein
LRSKNTLNVLAHAGNRWSRNMKHLRNATFAALLFGTTICASALADNPTATGCRPGVARAEAEGGGVGSVSIATRKTEAEGGGVGSVGNASRKAEAEGGGVGSVDQPTRLATTPPCQ